MKVLYALQGTGNGHVARAREIVPILASRCDLDVLVAGTQSQIALEYPIRFKKFGLTMKYNSSGGSKLLEKFLWKQTLTIHKGCLHASR